jgi:ubiquinone/menaquinone biosynthesis C-methylase UbiE
MNTTKTHWENMYQTKLSTEVSWYQGIPELSLQLIQKTGISSDDPIIEVGAGASTLVDCLLEKGFQQLTVLDIATAAMQHTQARLGDNAKKVQWIEADITQFQPPQQYQYWHDRAVFHFLTDAQDRKNYLQVLQTALRPKGYAMIATFAADGPEKCSGLNVMRYDTQRMGEALGNRLKLLEVHHESHVTPSGGEQKFIYFLFQNNA